MCALLRAFTHFNENLKIKKIKIQKKYVKKKRTREYPSSKKHGYVYGYVYGYREMYRVVIYTSECPFFEQGKKNRGPYINWSVYKF